MSETENPNPEAPASSTPATPAFDFEAFKAGVESKMNERISGLQSVYDRKLADAYAEIEQLKTATLSEDEREQLAEQEANSYIEQLERQVWLSTEAAKKYGKAAPHIQKLFESDGDVEAFAAYLESALNPAPEPEPEVEVSDVDPNNAPRSAVVNADSFVGTDGQVYTPELRKQILDSFGDQPFASLRKG